MHRPALPVAVFQPLPGIGDMVWHLPHIRALAAWAGAPVTLFTKPRSLADQLLADEPAVGKIEWLHMNPGIHDGPLGLLRLAALLRHGHFGTAILLHHGRRLASAAWLAGIPDRYGYGVGPQRLFLNRGPSLTQAEARQHQHDRATAFLRRAGIPLLSAEPSLTVSRRSPVPPPCIAIGIGASEALRQWGAANFAALAARLRDAGWPTLVLIGGPGDTEAAATIRAVNPHRIRAALGWHLADVTAVLAASAFYVGNNTGVMNMAAATETRTYALFGTTAPFFHASQIVPVTAPDTGVHDGMIRLTLDAVLAAITADRGSLGPNDPNPAEMSARPGEAAHPTGS